MSLRPFAPNSREVPEETKEFYWKNHGYVAFSIDDAAIPWDLREQLSRFMTRQYGLRNGQAGKRR